MTLFRYPLALIFNRLWPHHEGFNTVYTRQFKKKLTMPVICVGGFLTRQAATDVINQGLCDAVSVVDQAAYPMAFITENTGGRVFHCLLGHDAEVYASPGARALYQRGIAWAAGMEY